MCNDDYTPINQSTITNNNKFIFIGNNIQIKAKLLLVRYITTGTI